MSKQDFCRIIHPIIGIIYTKAKNSEENSLTWDFLQSLKQISSVLFSFWLSSDLYHEAPSARVYTDESVKNREITDIRASSSHTL